MGKIKIVLFNGFGGTGFPEHIYEQIIEKTSPKDRCGSIIEILEKYESVEEKDLQDRCDNLKIDEVLRYGNNFYFGAEPYAISCEIKEVDTSKKWTIGEYDGSEYIKYLEYKCIDEELNYWE